MAKKVFLSYPHFGISRMTYSEFKIYCGRMISNTERVSWEEGHFILPSIELAKQRFLTFKETVESIYVPTSKEEKNKIRDIPANFFIQSLKLACKSPFPDVHDNAELLFSVFQHIDIGLTRRSLSKQSDEFAKLRNLYAAPDMQAAIADIGLTREWEAACATEDEFLAFEAELADKEKQHKKHTDDKCHELQDAMKALTQLVAILTNVYEDTKAEHLMENFIIEMNQWAMDQKTEDTKKQNQLHKEDNEELEL